MLLMRTIAERRCVVINPVPNLPVVSGICASSKLASRSILFLEEVWLIKLNRFSSVKGLPEWQNCILPYLRMRRISTDGYPAEASLAF